MAPQLRDHDRYDILGEHGRGGLGRVSRAHDRELGRDIAIKELISRGHLSEVRFLREALITARLEHPGIVPVYEAGRWADGTPFYAMKLVSGRPLRELIAERKTVGERIGLLHHVIAVADAIAYAHGRSIIHRDLKPANVIVGDFGETVVIDWGLAKDLTAAEETTVGGGPFREHRDDGLTSAGTVLGTPAYMAPEQARGEAVDQRADVFAIGAMLWELCSLHKLLPSFSGQRRLLLRKAGIDPDLITIIEKAADPDPAGRYSDASALAADLKAFKAGARIAARRYSPWAMFAHWTRRHRAIAASATIAVTVAGVIATVYVDNIKIARDRAHAALAQVETTQTSLSREHEELTLKHAQLMLVTDPTSALDVLNTYSGSNQDRSDQLRAEAIGRGVANLRATPHSDPILWVQGLSKDHILSLSIDGTISRTTPDATSTVLARGVAARGGGFSYSSALHLLAYVCEPTNLCLLDTVHEKAVALPQGFGDPRVVGMDFSADGKQLATISPDGLVQVIDFGISAQPHVRFHRESVTGGGVLFVDEDVVAVSASDRLKLARTDGSIQTLIDPDGSFWAVDPTDHQLVLATRIGQVYLADTLHLKTHNRTTVCHDAIIGVKVIPGTHIVAFGCRDGTIGTLDPGAGAIKIHAHLDGHANLLDVSEDGQYIISAGDGGVFAVVDLRNDAVFSLTGHHSLLTAISPPSRDCAFFVSADVRGGMRAWLLPKQFARIVGDTHQRIFSAIYNDISQSVIAGVRASKLVVYDNTNTLSFVTPHLADMPFIAASHDQQLLAIYGFSATIELWSSSPLDRRQVIDTGHDTLSHVEFSDKDDLLISTKNGELFRRGSWGEILVARLNRSIITFSYVPRTNVYIVCTEDALWAIDTMGRVRLLAERTGRATALFLSPGDTSVYVGYAGGDVLTLDTSTLQKSTLLRAQSAIRDIAVGDQGNVVAIAANDDIVYMRVRNISDQQTRWVRLNARARRLAFTKDRMLIAAGTDGKIWVYQLASGVWTFIGAGTADLVEIVIAGDEKTAVAFAADGHLLKIDLDSVRRNRTHSQTQMDKQR